MTNKKDHFKFENFRLGLFLILIGVIWMIFYAGKILGFSIATVGAIIIIIFHYGGGNEKRNII